MRIPAHIGIIPDGNRRWAQQHQLPKQDGYHHGLTPGLMLLRLAREYGVREVTYYGFTTDNCKRPAVQLAAFSSACVQAVELIAKEPVSLLVVGNTESAVFPPELLPYTTRTALNGGGIRVNFLVNYGWEWDMGMLDLQSSNRRRIHDGLRSHDIARLDLVIRWGGMRRLSGFLPVQAVYADFYVEDKLWPDFRPKQFHDAMAWYQQQDATLGG